MPLEDKIQTIDSLRSQIDARGALDADLRKKINYTFRLQWNYTSNSMEGNTLTLEETRSVMVNNITVENKPLKDVLEMKGHDEVITHILQMGKGEMNISEKRIRDIHAAIMYEDDPEKRAKIGKWKTTGNYITNYKGERIDFTAPADLPDAMHQLINWLNAEKEKRERKTDAMHPALIAFKFHLDYLTIHPFYDGNGRTARILTNLILISYGYPPLYINATHTEAYYRYLSDIQLHGGAPDLFYEFMADRLIDSLQTVVDILNEKD